MKSNILFLAGGQLKKVVTIVDLYRLLTGVEPWPVNRGPVPDEVKAPAIKGVQS